MNGTHGKTHGNQKIRGSEDLLRIVAFAAQRLENLRNVIGAVRLDRDFQHHLVGVVRIGLELVVRKLDDVGAQIREDTGDVDELARHIRKFHRERHDTATGDHALLDDGTDRDGINVSTRQNRHNDMRGGSLVVGLALQLKLAESRHGNRACAFDNKLVFLHHRHDGLVNVAFGNLHQTVQVLRQEREREIAGMLYRNAFSNRMNLVSLDDVELAVKKIAGVRVPVLNNISLKVKPFGLFSAPKWYFDGIKLLQGLAKTAVEREFVFAKLHLLEHARKKTTQKVNLFEKVQIPGYQEAVRKIKRFMEDEENLSKSSQKILKSLQEKRKKEDAA